MMLEKQQHKKQKVTKSFLPEDHSIGTARTKSRPSFSTKCVEMNHRLWKASKIKAWIFALEIRNQ